MLNPSLANVAGHSLITPSQDFCSCSLRSKSCVPTHHHLTTEPFGVNFLNTLTRRPDCISLRRNFIGDGLNVTDNFHPTLLNSQPLVDQDIFYEGYLRIRGCDIRYMKHGHGPQCLFFSYGVLGEIRNSFQKQLTAFDPKMFTSIFWDPPGYGKSLPRGRSFVPYKYIEEDVDIAHDLLQCLGVSKVSMFGWCDGGHLSILFSLKFPHMVDKLIVWGTKASLTRDNLTVFERMRRLSSWSPRARNEVLKAYDEDVDYITAIFNQYVDTINIMFNAYGGNIYRDLLPLVNAPVLVLHSLDDVMVSRQQVQDLKEQLQMSQYHQFSSGGHSCHIKHWQMFNEVSLRFILTENTTW